MPRQARTVFAGVPHHITQRGNRREDVFYTDEDRETYLGWLNEYCQLHKVEILAYCLMTNHIHIIVLPKTDAWSSAAAHCEGYAGDVLTTKVYWKRK
jgi:putative transposase